MFLNRYEIIALCFTFHTLNALDYVYNKDVGLSYKYHNELLPWYDAKKVCQSENASLVMPRDKAEVKVLAKMIDYGIFHVHVGFHNLYADNNRHTYLALDGKDMQYYYNVWALKQPSVVENWRCGLLSKHEELSLGECFANRNFICQKGTSKVKTVPKNISCATSDSEYRRAEGMKKCFKIHMNPLGFCSAQMTCKNEGGNLAIIENSSEETFLKNMFNEPKYTALYSKWNYLAAVGVRDFYYNKQFMTVKDETLKYANWAPGRPSYERCVAMNKNGQLEDYPCDDSIFFICEIDADFSDTKNAARSFQIIESSTGKHDPPNSIVYNVYQMYIDEKVDNQ